MTTNFDPNDPEAARRAAQESVRAEQAEHRLQLLLEKRPPVFAAPGELHPDIQAWVNRYRQGHPGSLVLGGFTGTGKTWSLWKIAETLVRSGWRGRFEFVTAYDLRETIAPPVDIDRIDTWKRTDLFAIDDIGAQRISEWDADHLHALVDTRWQYQRPTLVTSNEPELKNVLGDRVASRLVDGATIVRFAGADRRRTR